jgi:diguanylate cyclase (GGDEF)-like protein
LLISGQPIGALLVWDNENENCYDEEALNLLSAVAAHLAVTLENARLSAGMEQLALTDVLTGLYTRRYFTELAGKEYGRALRYHTPLAAMMMDLDHFSDLNESSGHLIGDEVLQRVAAICRNGLRRIDLVARWDGETFAFLLPETEQESAFRVAERLRKTIASDSLQTSRGAVGVTASFGLSMLESGQRNLEELLGHAAQALCEAKQAGRNRIKLYIDPNLK